MSDRRRMPSTRQSITHSFSIEGIDCYITAGVHDDGTLGEFFVKAGSQGSTVQGLLDVWATTFSIALQHGADFRTLVQKFHGARFEPNGYTDNPEQNECTSMVDYIIVWLGRKFGDADLRSELT